MTCLERGLDPSRLVSPAIDRLPLYRPGKSIDEVRRTFGLEQVVKLASNESPFGPSPRALEAIHRALAGLNRYPDGAPELRGELAAHHGVRPEEIILGSGSSDLLELVVRTFATPEEHAVVSAGTFPAYRLFLAAAQIPFAEVPLRRMSVDLGAMAEAVRPETKLLFLANPNNPTGTWYGKEELEQFLAALPPAVVLVLDDAYVDYQAPTEVVDSLGVMRRRPRTLVTRTFSKAHGLASLRIGYAIGSEELLGQMAKVHRPFPVSQVATEAARASLADPGHLEQIVRWTAEGRAFLRGALAELGFTVLPSQANFVTADLGAEEKVRAFSQTLLERGLIVRPLQAFGLPGCVRISAGAPSENQELVREVRRLDLTPYRRE